MKKFAALFCLLSTLCFADVTQVTGENYNEFIKKAPAILDFYATWCGPCKRFAPIYEEVSQDYTNYQFGKVDGPEQTQLITKFNVRAFPTIIFLDKDGKEKARVQGALTKEKFKEEIEKVFK